MVWVDLVVLQVASLFLLMYEMVSITIIDHQINNFIGSGEKSMNFFRKFHLDFTIYTCTIY